MNGIQPVRRRRLYQDIVQQMQELFRTEELRPGERLPTERVLAERFGVSRATMREALSVLQARGLIVSRTGDGTFASEDSLPTVTPLAAELAKQWRSISEPLEVRRMFEPETCRLAAERASARDIEEMDRWLLRQESQVGDPQGYLVEDEGFHGAIARASKNSLLITISEAVMSALRESRRRSVEAPGATETSIAEHRRIIEAIRSRNGEEAYRAMRTHLETVERLAERGWTTERSAGVDGPR